MRRLGKLRLSSRCSCELINAKELSGHKKPTKRQGLKVFSCMSFRHKTHIIVYCPLSCEKKIVMVARVGVVVVLVEVGGGEEEK